MARKKKTDGDTAPDTSATDAAEETAPAAGADSFSAFVSEAPGAVPATPRAPLNPEKVIKVDVHGTGAYDVMDAPRGWWFDRRISLPLKGLTGDIDSGWVETVGIVNLEHVADDADGVWCYRRM